MALFNCWKKMFPLLCVIFIGCGLSVGAITLCFPACGGGHGTMVPMIFYLSPSFVVSMFNADHDLDTPLVLGTAVSLYAIYGLLIAAFRRWGRAQLGLWTVLVGHYVAAAATFVIESGDGVSDLGAAAGILEQFSVFYVMSLVFCWVALHVLAVQFALSQRPYRPRVTRATLGVLLASLPMGALLYAFCCAIGQ